MIKKQINSECLIASEVSMTVLVEIELVLGVDVEETEDVDDD